MYASAVRQSLSYMLKIRERERDSMSPYKCGYLNLPVMCPAYYLELAVPIQVCLYLHQVNYSRDEVRADRQALSCPCMSCFEYAPGTSATAVLCNSAKSGQIA